MFRRPLVAAAGAISLLAGGTAFAASGSSSDSTLRWTTDVSGVLSPAGLVTPNYSGGAGCSGCNPAEYSYTSPSGDTAYWSSPAGDNSGMSAPPNSGLYRPDGTVVQENTLFAYTTRPAAASLSFVFPSPEAYFGLLMNPRGTGTLTVSAYRGSTLVLSLDAKAIATHTGSDGSFDSYLNIGGVGGATFTRIQFDVGGVPSGIDDIAVGEVAYSQTSPVQLAQAASASVPEPSSFGWALGLVGVAGMASRAFQGRARVA